MSRAFNFEKIVNFRSLAGIRTRENAEIKAEHIYRSALLDFATPDDMDLLVDLAPDVVIDFRTDGEKQTELIKMMLTSIDYQARSIEVGNFFSKDQIEMLGQLKADDLDALFIKMYQEFPICGQSQFKAVFDAIADNERVIYHCSAGKDRTGVMSYLILSALDVPYDDIMENYLESNLYAEPLHQLFSENRDDDKLMGIIMTPELEKVFHKIRYVAPAYLDSLNKMMVTEHGGVQGYIDNVLKVDREKLKARLLG